MIVVATPDEVKLARSLFAEPPILIAGVGINTVRALADIPRDTEIINIGYAGGYGLTKGNMYAVNRCRMFHPNVEYTEPTFELAPIKDMQHVFCYTGGDFVLDYKGEPVLFDMELALICAMGFRVQAIKYVSDNLNYQEYEQTITTD